MRYQNHLAVLVVAGIIIFAAVGGEDYWRAASFTAAEQAREFAVFEEQLDRGQVLLLRLHLEPGARGCLQLQTPDGRKLFWGHMPEHRDEMGRIRVTETGTHRLILIAAAARAGDRTSVQVEVNWKITH
ncbi:MAG: hypothetical protein R6U70_06325 [Bacillota bacterium]